MSGGRICRPVTARAACSLLLAILGLLALLAEPASAFVYWADSQGQSIGRATNDGTGVNDHFISTAQLPVAVAVDGAHVYWVNESGGSIGRANIDGSGVDNSFIGGVKEPDGIAVNGNAIYWSTIPGPIGRAKLDGSNVNREFITGAIEPCGVALDSGHVYWPDIAGGVPAYIGRAGLDGQSKEFQFATLSTAFPCGIAVNSANIFWADSGFLGGGTRIGRANTVDGEGVDLSFIGNASAPCGVALDNSSHLYWTNSETATIGRANTDGTSVNQSFVATGANEPCGVAVDGLSSPPGQPPLSDRQPPETKIVKGPGKKLARGMAKFSFSASEAGSAFACKLDAKKAAPCRSPKRYRHLKPGRHTFKVWATDPAGNRDLTPAKRRFRVPGR